MGIQKLLLGVLLLCFLGSAWLWRAHLILRGEASELKTRVAEQESIINHLNGEVLDEQNRLNLETRKLETVEAGSRTLLASLRDQVAVKTKSVASLRQRLGLLQDAAGNNSVKKSLVERLQEQLRAQFAEMQTLENRRRDDQRQEDNISQAKVNSSSQDYDVAIKDQKNQIAALQSQLKAAKSNRSNQDGDLKKSQAALLAKTARRNQVLGKIAILANPPINSKSHKAGAPNLTAIALAQNELALLNNEIAALETHIQNNESVNSANTSKSQEVADLENRISQSNARLREIESLKIENKRAVDANHQAVTDNLNEAKAALRMLEVQYSAAVKSYRQTQDQIQMILHAERGDEKAIESLKASLSKEELELNQLTSELANKEAELKSIEN
jgi:hypothetical protein